MKRPTFRWRIALWSALVAGLAVALFGGVVVFVHHSELLQTLDQRMAAEARLALTDAAEPNLTDALEALVNNDRLVFGYAILGPDGSVIRAQPETLARLAPFRTTPRSRYSARLGDESVRFGVYAENGTTLLLVASLRDVRESLGDLLQAYAVAVPGVVLLAAGGSWWLAGRVLRPIVAITRQAESITAERLHERLPQTATDDEIARHVRVLNGMLDRLERSFLQAGRFAADASHELRTPLTILRGEIERALQSGRFGPDQEEVLVDLMEQAGSLQKITDNLLLLARFDSGRMPLEKVTVDLSALLAEVAEDAELLADPRQLHLEIEAMPALQVQGDPVLLRRVLLNLIENAVRYNRTGGTIRLSLLETNREIRLSVANTGPGIPPSRRAGLFERFYRIAPDRGLAGGGSGLGLSLCREIVQAHGGRIELSGSDAEWTTFTVRLPLLDGKIQS